MLNVIFCYCCVFIGNLCDILYLRSIQTDKLNCYYENTTMYDNRVVILL